MAKPNLTLKDIELYFFMDPKLLFDIQRKGSKQIEVNGVSIEISHMTLSAESFYQVYSRHETVKKFKSIFDLLKGSDFVPFIPSDLSETFQPNQAFDINHAVKLPMILCLLQHAVVHNHEALLNLLNQIGSCFNELEQEIAHDRAKKYKVNGREAVEKTLQDIVSATEKMAKKEQAYGKFYGDIQQHGDVYAAHHLKEAFDKHFSAVELGQESLKDAQKNLSEAIRSARANLGSHDQTKYLLANLAAALFSLGIVPVVMRLHTGQWQFFRPANAWRLDKLEQMKEGLKSSDEPHQDKPSASK